LKVESGSSAKLLGESVEAIATHKNIPPGLLNVLTFKNGFLDMR
jgi:hypothetical protein